MLLKIGQFATLSGVTVETLRHWDAVGLLQPGARDEESGYRLYDTAQLAVVYRILALKDVGFSLKEMAAILEKHTGTATLLALLEEKAVSLQKTLALEQVRLERLLNNIFLVKNGGIPIMNETTIKQVSPILVCAQRRTIAKADFDAELEMMWPAVNRHIEGAGGKAVIPCMMCYHSGTWDYAGDTLDIEVIEPLAATIPAADAEGIAVYTLPAEAQMACIVHKGPFATIGKTYAALMDWVKQNGYHATGALREIYHKGEWLTDDLEEYITELQVPVAK